MTQPDVDRELERLLVATRAGTEPDAEARSRVRAALLTSLAGAGTVGTARAGLRGKLWLLTVLGVVVASSIAAWFLLQRPPTVHGPALVSSVAALPAAEPSVVAAPAASAAPAIDQPIPPPSSLAVASVARPLQARSTSKIAEPADELALVSSMQLALRSGNAVQGLALANEHARRFPRGALAQEREGARAIAKCQLAPPAGRSVILANFEQRYVGSPYAARVRDACAH